MPTRSGFMRAFFAKAPAGKWVLTGIDVDGIDIADGDDIRRIFYPEPLPSAEAMRAALVSMAQEARKGLAQG
jgi:heme iron utilization protein